VREYRCPDSFMFPSGEYMRCRHQWAAIFMAGHWVAFRSRRNLRDNVWRHIATLVGDEEARAKVQGMRSYHKPTDVLDLKVGDSGLTLAEAIREAGGKWVRVFWTMDLEDDKPVHGLLKARTLQQVVDRMAPMAFADRQGRGQLSIERVEAI